MTDLLTTDKISLVYTDGERNTYALRDVSIEIPDRKFIGIMGPSGSGKSSLLYILSGLKRPTGGEVRLKDYAYGGRPDRELVDLRRTRFGFVFQQPYLLVWQTAMENVLMGAPELHEEARRKAQTYFDQLGIARLQNKLPSQLSGGEKQRVCVARAMMNDPEIIFADEPTASLDHTNGRLVIDLLSAYRERGTVIVVTHDPEMLTGADTVLMMRDGESQGWVTPDQLAEVGAKSKTISLGER
ncbi:ABC transporter ATP-binding protein [Capsulimonas corticalis]|uniref:ABC transporter ATP-binding protein n=1 Tax=Capsulimonas corticalis TaxID=2219043 RepID=A0A402CY62_9BACT|nr:ABC transporter ATP-binding protein [Capsulimonas corticalis]BDI31439.1 ABC transporter ATP-binding protein [Capsulimonas corticalis]